MRRIPDVALGVFLASAIFATGVAVGSNYQLAGVAPGTAQAQGSWLTKDPAGFFTFLLVVVGVAQLALFGSQLWFMRRSLVDTRASAEAAEAAARVAEKSLTAAYRAWVKIDCVTISQPLIFDDTGVRAAVSVRITNIGNAPALKISPHAWLYVLRRATSLTPGPIEDQRKRCAELKEFPFTGITTLFPNESYPENARVKESNFGISATRAEIARGIAEGEGKLRLYVGGCIDYCFPTDPNAHHQTRFLFDLIKNVPEPITPQDGVIPANALRLLDTIFGDGRSAD